VDLDALIAVEILGTLGAADFAEGEGDLVGLKVVDAELRFPLAIALGESQLDVRGFYFGVDLIGADVPFRAAVREGVLAVLDGNDDSRFGNFVSVRRRQGRGRRRMWVAMRRPANRGVAGGGSGCILGLRWVGSKEGVRSFQFSAAASSDRGASREVARAAGSVRGPGVRTHPVDTQKHRFRVDGSLKRR
jgi:hypothetical protein